MSSHAKVCERCAQAKEKSGRAARRGAMSREGKRASGAGRSTCMQHRAGRRRHAGFPRAG
ncbi:hypothetical protein WK21_23300 [Burkholderia cepacia]|nr:hypothetical protein WK21_23300 [Burkholderia cepacia]